MTKKEKQFIDDMKRTRGIDFARIGMMVEVSGDYGTIKGMSQSASLIVKFANELKHGKDEKRCHPEYNIRYFDDNGNVIKVY